MYADAFPEKTRQKQGKSGDSTSGRIARALYLDGASLDFVPEVSACLVFRYLASQAGR